MNTNWVPPTWEDEDWKRQKTLNDTSARDKLRRFLGALGVKSAKPHLDHFAFTIEELSKMMEKANLWKITKN